MQLFDELLACEIGLVPAIVNQTLIQESYWKFHPKDAEHGVIEEDGKIWFRFDDEHLAGLFPYLSLPEIHKTLYYLEAIGKIFCRRSKTTDYIWIA